MHMTGQYSVAEIGYFIKKRNENDKNTIFFDEKQKNDKKVYVNIK